MFVLARAATYSTLFIGLLLVFLPARVLAWSGVVRPAAFGPIELVGAIVALGGAAIVYHSVALLGYVLLFGGSTHLFVVSYEEPTLSRLFGADYQAYRSRVNRWLPGV